MRMNHFHVAGSRTIMFIGLVVAMALFGSQGLETRAESINLNSLAMPPRGIPGDLWADVIIGQRDFSEFTPYAVVPYKVFNPAGVTVDRTVSPGRAYIWDSGNSRILGIDLASCYSGTSPCHADLVIGQPSASDYSACNGDSGFQQYPSRAPAGADSVKGKPLHNKWLIHYSDYEIVSAYGAQIRGLVNYYQLAPNISQQLESVYWACLESCRKTLVAKHKLRKTQSYQRYYTSEPGKRKHIRVVIERPDKKPLIARCGELPLKHRPNAAYANDVIPPFTVIGRQRELTKRLLAEQCECCGTTGVPLEGHHVNKLANLKHRWQGQKQKPAWVTWMISRRRKTIFVCHPCHQDITYGRYDGAKLC